MDLNSHSEPKAIPLYPPKRLAVSLEEAAEMLGVCGRTLAREIRRDKLKAFRVGRSWRVAVAELQGYIARQQQAASGKASA